MLFYFCLLVFHFFFTILCYAILYITVTITITISDRSSNSKSITVTIHNRSSTPRSHSNNALSKICSKGWVAQKLFLIGSLRAALRFSKGWVRKDANLGSRTGCNYSYYLLFLFLFLLLTGCNYSYYLLGIPVPITYWV